MAAKRIERLSAEAERLIPVVRDEWLAAGLSCEPTDRERAVAGVKAAYAAAGLSAPGLVSWLRSPFEGVIGAAMLANGRQVGGQVGDQVRGQVWGQVWDQVGGQVRDQVWGQVWDQVGGQVRDQVRGQVWDQVWDQVGDQVRDQVRGQVGNPVWDQVRDQVGNPVGDQVRDQVRGQVGDQVRDQVRGQVWDQVWDQVGGQVRDQVWGQVRGQVGGQVWDQVRDQVRDQVGVAVYGQHDAGWLSFYDFFRRAYNLQACKRLTGLNEVALSAGWWWPFQNAVVLTDRPIALHRDDEGRLHHESRLAIEYADGWGVWAWHGVRVPQQIIEHPETITATEVIAEENAEIRRAMIERMGPERFLTEAAAQPVQQDDYGKLWRVDLDDDEPLVMVELLNSTVEPDGTQRTYFLRVDPNCATARGAAAWTFGMRESDYVLAAQS